jgi:hypothetical protein
MYEMAELEHPHISICGLVLQYSTVRVICYNTSNAVKPSHRQRKQQSPIYCGADIPSC